MYNWNKMNQNFSIFYDISKKGTTFLRLFILFYQNSEKIFFFFFWKLLNKWRIITVNNFSLISQSYVLKEDLRRKLIKEFRDCVKKAKIVSKKILEFLFLYTIEKNINRMHLWSFYYYILIWNKTLCSTT